jgi:hypothetical protein
MALSKKALQIERELLRQGWPLSNPDLAGLRFRLIRELATEIGVPLKHLIKQFKRGEYRYTARL